MNRIDFQQLAQLRIKEAEALLQATRYDGAYYLAGYTIECALKACIAKQIREHDFPDKNLLTKIYTHDLEQLIGVAGLHGKLSERSNLDKDFAVNWNLVKAWK